jgi:hypothetical protein
MKIFHYDEQTGELIGEGVADADPLDAGNWLIPAHATNVEPPEAVEGSTRHFIAGGWEYREIPPPPQPAPEPQPLAIDAAAPATDAPIQ